MKDALDAIVGVILQACPFAIMTNSGERRTDVSLAQRLVIIAVAFVLAGIGAALPIVFWVGQRFVVFDERQQQRIANDIRHDADIAAIKADLASRTDDRYRGSEARRDREALERQIAELRERLAALEGAHKGTRQ